MPRTTFPNAIAGLSENISVRFDLFGGSNGSNGTFRMDDFVLNGFTTAVEEWRPMGYRFGYQGSEKDDEVKGQGNSYTTEFRQYDARVGRWLSLDPLMAKFPNKSGYNFVENSPLTKVDTNGLAPSGDDPKKKARIAAAKEKVKIEAKKAIDRASTEQKASVAKEVTKRLCNSVKVIPTDKTKSSSDDSEAPKNAGAPNLLPYAEMTVVKGVKSAFAEEGIITSTFSSTVRTVSLTAFSILTPHTGHYPVNEMDSNIQPLAYPATFEEFEEKRLPPKILYHYTNAAGMTGIVLSGEIFPSLKSNNPKDARYGDGVYWSDITPGTMSSEELAYTFIRVPNKYKYTHFVAIIVSSFPVIFGRPDVFVTQTSINLPVAGKIMGYGFVPK